MATDYLKLFPAKHISFSVEAGSKPKIIEALVDLAIKGSGLDDADRSKVLKAVLKRENAGSTGVGGVAIPHVKTAQVPGPVAAIAVFKDGVEFDAIDGEPVYSIFLTLSPEADVEEHVSTLRWIAGVARKPDYTKFVRQTSSAKEVRSLLEEMSA